MLTFLQGFRIRAGLWVFTIFVVDLLTWLFLLCVFFPWCVRLLLVHGLCLHASCTWCHALVCVASWVCPCCLTWLLPTLLFLLLFLIFFFPFIYLALIVPKFFMLAVCYVSLINVVLSSSVARSRCAAVRCRSCFDLQAGNGLFIVSCFTFIICTVFFSLYYNRVFFLPLTQILFVFTLHSVFSDRIAIVLLILLCTYAGMPLVAWRYI